MLFKRREAQGYWERFKLWLWPRVSWRRSGALLSEAHPAAFGNALRDRDGRGGRRGGGLHAVPRLPFHPDVPDRLALARQHDRRRDRNLHRQSASPIRSSGQALISSATCSCARRATMCRCGLGEDLLHKSWDQLLADHRADDDRCNSARSGHRRDRLSYCLQSGFGIPGRPPRALAGRRAASRLRRPNSRNLEHAPPGPPSWRQHRPCGDRAERPRRQRARSGARSADRREGRRGRHHRASARGSPAHHRFATSAG